MQRSGARSSYTLFLDRADGSSGRLERRAPPPWGAQEAAVAAEKSEPEEDELYTQVGVRILVIT